MVAVLQEQPAVAPLREQRWRLPSVIELIGHPVDGELPLVRRFEALHVGLRTGEALEIGQRQARRPVPPVRFLRERGSKRRVVAAAAGQEVADPPRHLLVASVGGGAGTVEAEAPDMAHQRVVPGHERAQTHPGGGGGVGVSVARLLTTTGDA